VLEAVLFDWGDTLMRFEFDEALIGGGHRAGLAALGRERLPPVEELTAHFRERYEPLFWVSGTLEEIDYPALVRRCLADLGLDLSEAELDRYLAAEHAAWEPARVLERTTPGLLDALRDRGLRLGLVSNAFDPPRLLHGDLERMGVGRRLDVAVFSSEVGLRKPHPAIFERALAALGVEPERALFVGDRLYEDVRGAGELGMTTVLAAWYRLDEHPNGGEPDFVAAAQSEVLDVVGRLLGGAGGI